MYSRSEVIGSWRKQDSGNQGWNKQDSTGRISFKLYDWNPAEFPRRLRHQIFQWLSSMPVELEGYIRPGCIILTLFIAMPHFTGRSKFMMDVLVPHFVPPSNFMFELPTSWTNCGKSVGTKLRLIEWHQSHRTRGAKLTEGNTSRLSTRGVSGLSIEQTLPNEAGGEEIYVGPLGHNSCHLIKYFEVSPNPNLIMRNKLLIKELSVPPPSSKDLYFSTQYSQPILTQCTACLWKQHLSYWRDPAYTAVQIFFTIVVALMFGFRKQVQCNGFHLYNSSVHWDSKCFNRATSCGYVTDCLLQRKSCWDVFCFTICVCTSKHFLLGCIHARTTTFNEMI
ncbi:hypothetical protein IFM89_027777 [Coptis chinensis]|uniref:ABC-2 type transporter transmembrane domain-containing protein n=1 Tax=Coptis chinensis TaxID=261450 RepID=A0A835LZY0_9MAGN|nr:hypothetical protein IFM89_027777 [Coptis chinensis]